jgi:hypothetical protein
MWVIVLVVLPILGLLLFGLISAAIFAVAITAFTYLSPVLLIVAGIWLLSRAIHGSDRSRRARHDARAQRRAQRRPTAPPAPAQPGPQQRHLEQRPAAPPRRELPIDVQVKAEQIRHKVHVLLSYADRFSPFSQDLYLVRQIAADYLPRTIHAYLAVPGFNDPPIVATGRTALEELREQLRLLDAKLDDITLNLQRQDLDGLVANRRFLEERFGADPGVTPFTAPRRTAAPSEGGATMRTA